LKKYQVTIEFYMDEEFMTLIPPHRVYIDHLIEKGVVDHYVVSMETQRVWITFTAENREEVELHLSRSPIFKYWKIEVDELVVFDGHHYRLPAVQLN
jgi:muconolactone delta-isomerase